MTHFTVRIGFAWCDKKLLMSLSGMAFSHDRTWCSITSTLGGEARR